MGSDCALISRVVREADPYGHHRSPVRRGRVTRPAVTRQKSIAGRETRPLRKCSLESVGNGLRCQGHIVYKLFGHMVYNFDKLSTEDFSRNKELFIQIDFGNYELTIAKGNDITL